MFSRRALILKAITPLRENRVWLRENILSLLIMIYLIDSPTATRPLPTVYAYHKYFTLYIVSITMFQFKIITVHPYSRIDIHQLSLPLRTKGSVWYRLTEGIPCVVIGTKACLENWSRTQMGGLRPCSLVMHSRARLTCDCHQTLALLAQVWPKIVYTSGGIYYLWSGHARYANFLKVDGLTPVSIRRT